MNVGNWQPEVCQLLNEHHLVASSDAPANRLRFASLLGQFLQGLRDTEVCPFYGSFITDLDSFCHQLERAVPGPVLERSIDGPQGVRSLLRCREALHGRPATKFRFYIWHDADVLVRNDERLFGELVNAFAGVAAEAEYASDDTLLIHRAIFVGGRLLEDYAESEHGRFQSWREEGEPGWWLSALNRPPVARCPIDDLHI